MTKDDDPVLDVSCNGNQIITTKTNHQYVDTYWGPPQLIEKKTFVLNGKLN